MLTILLIIIVFLLLTGGGFGYRRRGRRLSKRETLSAARQRLSSISWPRF